MTRIYVGNLPYTADEESVRELFSQHGAVEAVRLINDRETGRFRGFCFVEMPESDAQNAIARLNGHDMGAVSCASTKRVNVKAAAVAVAVAAVVVVVAVVTAVAVAVATVVAAARAAAVTAVAAAAKAVAATVVAAAAKAAVVMVAVAAAMVAAWSAWTPLLRPSVDDPEIPVLVNASSTPLSRMPADAHVGGHSLF